MKKTQHTKGGDTPFIVIFTDLDGTLLGHDTYRWDMAKPALDLCKRHHIPVVLVSSKTSAEINPLRKQMGLSAPFISENGGGIFFPVEGLDHAPLGTILAENMYKLEMGTRYKTVLNVLGKIRDKLHLPIQGFSEMSPEEIARLTGLDLENACLAAKREFDEPFIISGHQEFDVEALQRAAQKKGLQITTGGRFFHILGQNDKGRAVKTLISWYEQSHSNVLSVALGDSPNDFSMLKQVDQPILIRSHKDYTLIAKKIPDIIMSREFGPKGWNTTIIELINKKTRGGIPNNV